MGIIDTATKELLPWRSQLWDENLARVGGVTRIYGADIAPDDSYFVVTSGSGGDAPPISDTAIALPADRCVAPGLRRAAAVDLPALRQHLLGGHHRGRGLRRRALRLHRVADLRRPVARPGQRRLRHRPGPGRLRPRRPGGPPRPHRGPQPDHGKALEWNPTSGSNSFEGDKAMEATPRGLFIGGDGMFKGGVRTGRVGVLRLQHRDQPARPARHHDHHPHRGSRGRQQHALRGHRHGAGRHRQRRTGAGADPGPRQRPVPHLRPTRGPAPHDGQRHARGRHHEPDVDPGQPDRHDQPQPAGLGAGVHRRHRRHRRLHPGHQEDRVVQHRGPDADHRHLRAERRPDLDHLHRDRHRQRRQGRQLAELLVPRRAEPLPAGRRHGGTTSSTPSVAPRTSSAPQRPPGPTR